MFLKALITVALVTSTIVGAARPAEAVVGGDAVSVVCPIDRVTPVQVLNYVFGTHPTETVSAWYRFVNVRTGAALDSGWQTSTVRPGQSLPKASFFVAPGNYRVHVWYHTAASGVVGVPTVYYRTSGFGPTSNCFVP